MFIVINSIRALGLRLWMAFAAVAGAAVLAFDVVRIRFDRSVPFADAMRTYLFTAANQRRVFDVLRFVQPIWVMKKVLVKTYASIGTVMLSRFDDCEEVIRREADFENVYEPVMRDICGGSNFFLGMQDTPEYTRDVANMRETVRREDLEGRLVPFVARLAEDIVAASRGRLDVARDLVLTI